MYLPYINVSIEEMLKAIDGPNREVCLKIYKDNARFFKKVPGSRYNHQTWAGGYYDHVQEGMNWGIVFYEMAELSGRILPFSLSDFLLIFFLHDIEKPWKYRLGRDGRLYHKRLLNTKKSQREFRDKKLREYGIVLSAEQENAMKYAEGEMDDYSSERRVMNELAGFVHMMDVWSARVCHNYPRKTILLDGLNPNTQP